jgi:hypothetical protein
MLMMSSPEIQTPILLEAVLVREIQTLAARRRISIDAFLTSAIMRQLEHELALQLKLESGDVNV